MSDLHDTLVPGECLLLKNQVGTILHNISALEGTPRFTGKGLQVERHTHPNPSIPLGPLMDAISELRDRNIAEKLRRLVDAADEPACIAHGFDGMSDVAALYANVARILAWRPPAAAQPTHIH